METYKPNILVCGYSGSGKSTSIEMLPQDGSTAIVETELKALPFRHKFTKVTTVDNYEGLIPAINKYKADPEVKVIVVDSTSKHLERCLNYCRMTLKNYDIWTMYGRLGSTLMDAMHSKDKIMIGISLDELVEEESNNTGVVAKTYRKMAATHMGKELQGKLDKEFTVVLHAMPKFNPATKLLDFNFLCKPDGLTTAKTPRSMFKDRPGGLIPNDLNLVIKELEKITELDTKVEAALQQLKPS